MSLNTISPSVLNLYIINEEIVKLANRSITLVTKKDNNKKYIMIKYSNLTDIEKNEIRMFISLPKNESLVQCYNIIFSLYDNMYYCFIDYANKMTLHHFIVDKKQNEYIDEGIIWKFLIQMLYAIYPLHSNKIIHRNIKNSNFFLYDDYTIKLGGFKLCEYNNEKNSLSNFASSLNYFYASPEMINKESYDYNSDIWSIGMCIYEMCFPQNEFNQLDMYLNALQGKIKEINLKIYSQELFDVICLMMRNNKVSRPSCEKMLSNQIILSHVYDPMKYLDVLSCGKGYIEKIQKLNEIDDFNYYVNEYVSSHFDNENSIENKIENNIEFTTSSEDEIDYSNPVLFNNCANPITLCYVNSNLKSDYTLTDNISNISYDGSLLKRCNITLNSIACKLSFLITIKNNLDEVYTCPVILSMPL